MADKQTFETVLSQHPGMEATGITIPFDVEQIYGAKRVSVKAYINGTEYRGSIVRMGGEFCLGIPKVVCDASGIKAGDHIVVTIEKDTDERMVTAPNDLAAELANRGLSEAWNALSYTHRKEQVRGIEDAKQPETRIRRIEKAAVIAEARKTK